MKAALNRTIELSETEEKKYLKSCITVDSPVSYEDVSDKTLIGDCLSVMPYLPEKSVDLLIADPPYNLDKAYHGSSFKKISDDGYEAYTREWLEKALPLLKKNASVYVCCDVISSAIIYSVLNDLLIVRNRITWQREKGRGSKQNWKNSMEDIWFATVSKEHTFNLDSVKVRRRVIAPYKEGGKPKDWQETQDGRFRDTCPSNFWDDISVPYWSMPENTCHPTQKPEKLLAKLILASSNEGDIVFDPFLGSGSTSVAAKKLNRHFIGIEKDRLYCALAQKRLEMADSDKRIQGFSDGVFWERNTAALQSRFQKGKETI